MNSCCYSQDSFESNFPPLEFLIEEEQQVFNSQQLQNQQNDKARIEGDFVLETPPSQKVTQKPFIEVSSPVTLSKIQMRPTESLRFDGFRCPLEDFPWIGSAKNYNFSKSGTASTTKHIDATWPEGNQGSCPPSFKESYSENIIDVDDACSIEMIEDNSFSFGHERALAEKHNKEASYGKFDIRSGDEDLSHESNTGFHCEDRCFEVYDVLQHAALPGETRQDTIKRLGHEKLWELALTALIQGKKVVGDESIYAKEDWRKEKLTKMQIMELFGCQNTVSLSLSHSTNAHFLGAGDLYKKNSSNNTNWNAAKARQYPKNNFTHFQRNKFQKKKAKKNRHSAKNKPTLHARS